MEASARSIEQQETNMKKIKSRPLIASIILIVGTVLLALSMGMSISFGAADISLKLFGKLFFNSMIHLHIIMSFGSFVSQEQLEE